MDLQSIPIASLLALAVSLFALWRTERVQNRSRANELYLLRQNLLLKAEAARSEWYKLDRETDTLVHRLSLNNDLNPELRKITSNFLQDRQEFFRQCIADASAFAEHAHTNRERYTEKECRERLTAVEVSLEKLRRNQGEAERRFNQLMETAAAHNGTGVAWQG
ncbi:MULTISPECIES: hypothetical protein [Pseudomonas syringae group]|uniref:hypothetical protein n=1 Tax=Pseudomonas syringae group TaxID=136849 RepID=UPI000A7D0628|nr:MULTISPECIES: hypothetical protein [Pseudomonas syringae group]